MTTTQSTEITPAYEMTAEAVAYALTITCPCPRCGKRMNIEQVRQQGSCAACLRETYGTPERAALYANRAKVKSYAELA